MTAVERFPRRSTVVSTQGDWKDVDGLAILKMGGVFHDEGSGDFIFAG